MALFALRRLVLAIPLLIGITFISFMVIQLAPGGPFDYLRGEESGHASKIAGRLPITLFINLIQMFIIVALAIPIGVASATRQYSLFDKVTTVFVFLGFATPDFWLALLLMILFGVQLDWLPISGLRSLNYEYLGFWQKQWG